MPDYHHEYTIHVVTELDAEKTREALEKAVDDLENYIGRETLKAYSVIVYDSDTNIEIITHYYSDTVE